MGKFEEEIMKWTGGKCSDHIFHEKTEKDEYEKSRKERAI